MWPTWRTQKVRIRELELRVERLEQIVDLLVKFDNSNPNIEITN
jgi:hypothetical protein